MTRAWMLLIGLGLSTLVAAGCDSTGLMSHWMHGGRERTERPLTSEPVGADSPATAPAEDVIDDDAPADDRVARLNEQIEQFFGQFPVDQGTERPAAGGGTGAAPVTSTASTTQPAVDTAESAPLERDSGSLANSTAGAEVVASPQPPETTPATPRQPRVELLDIRPVAEPPPSAATAAPSPTPPNHPAQTPPLAASPNTLAGRIQELETSISANPAHLDDQLRLRLLYMATGQRDKATGPFDGLDPMQTELLTTLCEALVAATDIILQPDETPDSAWLAVEQLHRLLGQQSSVVIPRMAMVTRVNSFGDYHAINPPRFSAGEPIHVFLYTEVGNFRSKPTGDGKLQTLLSQRVEIYDAAGNVVWQRTEPTIEDRTLTPRRDFFVPFPITLPADMPPGEYVLKATIEDKIGATTDQRRMTFTVE